MTLLNESTLRTLFRARLKTVSNLPAEQFLAWQNRAFLPPDPEDDQPWVREYVTILSESKTTQCHIEATGLVQYVVVIPSGRGTKKGDDLVKAIAEAFESGQALNTTGLTVILEHTERGPYLEDPQTPVWTFKTITARWRVFTASST